MVDLIGELTTRIKKIPDEKQDSINVDISEDVASFLEDTCAPKISQITEMAGCIKKSFQLTNDKLQINSNELSILENRLGTLAQGSISEVVGFEDQDRESDVENALEELKSALAKSWKNWISKSFNPLLHICNRLEKEPKFEELLKDVPGNIQKPITLLHQKYPITEDDVGTVKNIFSELEVTWKKLSKLGVDDDVKVFLSVVGTSKGYSLANLTVPIIEWLDKYKIRQNFIVRVEGKTN